MEIMYTHEDGSEEVKFRRPFPGKTAWDLIRQVQILRTQIIEQGFEPPYSYRFVDDEA